MSATTPVLEAADEIAERFTKSGWTLAAEAQQRSGPGFRSWNWFMTDVTSKFVTATLGQEIEFADATVRDESRIEFLVITNEAVAFLSTHLENESPSIAPPLRLIPRSRLRALDIIRGIHLNDPKWGQRKSEGIVIEVDYGLDEIKTLPLNPDDVQSFISEGTTSPVNAELEKLLPGLIRDLNR